MNYLGNNIDKLPSPIVNPFDSENVDGITFHLHYWGIEKYWKGSVKFKKGNTSGEYETKDYPADQFQECVKDIENAIKSTKK